ncbi:hypothetical protein RHMOL_Rhmol08G0153800 [Rhododendron molle]|uniref:Uncharacterized protein n=1 Tax=Rhododendron molle TaxID=49168 RepID=A0ACC0MNM2_RHOML|nr:hypothetical protein RHMOL_Rhmol08G0153800 [Rhododendron molle]
MNWHEGYKELLKLVRDNQNDLTELEFDLTGPSTAGPTISVVLLRVPIVLLTGEISPLKDGPHELSRPLDN